MIISHLIGGIGNQMFQYAVGKAATLRLDVPLKLDVSHFESYKLHQGFELDRVFTCHIDLAKKSDIRDILGWRSSLNIRKFLSRPHMKIFCGDTLVIEPHSHYWEGIKNIHRNTYLLGYWQSMRYFDEFSSEIRADFSFKMPFSGKNTEIIKKIRQVNSVSLHVRRGDYVQVPQTAVTHGLCSQAYYRAAIQYVESRVDNPYFFIFSDDIDWVKRSLKIQFPCQYVDHNQGVDSHNDMHLMSLCAHNIIANSTFSWWGAWLNLNPRKIVVAPNAWLADTNVVSNYKQFMDDLIPINWVRL